MGLVRERKAVDSAGATTPMIAPPQRRRPLGKDKRCGGSGGPFLFSRCWRLLLLGVAIGLTVPFLYRVNTVSQMLPSLSSQSDSDPQSSHLRGDEPPAVKHSSSMSPSVPAFEGFKENLLHLNPELIWTDLLLEAVSSNKPAGIVMEVGMHRAFQCIQAAEAGLQAHCVEPSPNSFQRVQNAVNTKVTAPEVKERIHLYQKAASDTSGIMVPFSGAGGTGDFVGAGEYDVWTMTKRDISEQPDNARGKHTVEVATVALDDIIRESPEQQAYLIKIDVQGYEPNVLKGLTQTLSKHAVKFILMEYWAKGIDFMSDELGSCRKPVEMLELLVQHGYTLYATTVVAHPKAPKGSTRKSDTTPSRPLHDLRENCLWYYQNEQTWPSEEYKMGYWSDILAVAPGMKLTNPTTPVGIALSK
jgi:FkbM family methyltransferase